jgi:hypothetical protein
VSKAKRLRAEREAQRVAHLHTQRDEGTWLGNVSEDHPVARVVIRRYNEASRTARACPHLHAEPDQPRFWVEAVPELISCKQCTVVVAEEERKRANTCCLLCGEHVELRGTTVAVAGVVLRCGICSACELRTGLV